MGYQTYHSVPLSSLGKEGKLRARSLKALDESHQHEGHAGHRPGGETHFRIYIVADAFQGKSRIARHRMINDILAHELKSGVHALAIHAAAPGEAPT